MAKRKSDDTLSLLQDLFMATPWWVCPLVAAIAYLGLSYILPLAFNSQPSLKEMSNVSRLFAPWAAALVLLIGIVTRLKMWSSSLMLDNQNGVDTINSLTWRDFEELIGAAYRRQGYNVIETGGGGADGGVDLVLRRNDEKVIVQCKHWRSSKVGVKLIRELHGLTHSKEYGGSRGIFVTFGEYTTDAKAFAKENGIELIDRRSLLKMIESAKRTQSEQTSSEIIDDTPPSCPLCGAVMVLRTAKRGNNIGNEFWGCSSYPKCRGTRDR